MTRMSEPKRYWMDDQNDADFPYEAVDGEWVKYEDYARLKAEVERLTKAGDAMAGEMGLETYAEEHFKQQKEFLDAWNAAKEGKGQP